MKSTPGVGYTSYNAPPLGSAYTDAYRAQRAPTPPELVKEVVGTAYACADLNAGGVAATQRKLLLKTAAGQPKTRLWKTARLDLKTLRWLKSIGQESVDGEIEQITDMSHPLLALLAKPTRDPSGLGAYDLFYCTQLYLESIGKAYWYIIRNSLGVPSEIWLLRSQLVREVPNYSTEGGDLISGYQYGRAVLSPDDVIRFHMPDPAGLYYGGYGPMQAAFEKIKIGRKEDAHISALLDNMGRPDAIWSPKGDSEGGGIGDAEARRQESIFRQRFRMAGRGGLMVAESPGQVEVLGWKPQDVVEIERAKAIKTDIANCFGVPDALIERNAANLASAKTADYSHAKYAINQRCCRMAEVLNARLVRLFDPSGRLFLAFDNPVPNDEVFELEQTRTGGTLGVATVDEGRTSLGLDPLGKDAGGDVRYISNTLVPTDAQGMPIVPKPTEPAPLTKPKAKRKGREGRMLARAARSLSDAATRLAEANNKPDGSAALVEIVKELLKEKKNGTRTTDASGNSTGGNQAESVDATTLLRNVRDGATGDAGSCASACDVGDVAGAAAGSETADAALESDQAASNQEVVSDGGAAVQMHGDESTDGELLPAVRSEIQSALGDGSHGAEVSTHPGDLQDYSQEKNEGICISGNRDGDNDSDVPQHSSEVRDDRATDHGSETVGNESAAAADDKKKSSE